MSMTMIMTKKSGNNYLAITKNKKQANKETVKSRTTNTQVKPQAAFLLERKGEESKN